MFGCVIYPQKLQSSGGHNISQMKITPLNEIMKYPNGPLSCRAKAMVPISFLFRLDEIVRPFCVSLGVCPIQLHVSTIS